MSEQNFEQNKRFLRALPAGRISHFTSRIYPSLTACLSFPRLVLVAFFPAPCTACKSACMSSPRLVLVASVVACFPAPCTAFLFFPCLVTVFMFFSALHCFPVFPALGTGCLFSRPWYWLHIFPRLSPVARFPRA